MMNSPNWWGLVTKWKGITKSGGYYAKKQASDQIQSVQYNKQELQKEKRQIKEYLFLPVDLPILELTCQ